MNMFEEFDAVCDIEGIKKDISEQVSKTNTEYTPVPFGEYIVTVDRLELKKSKKGNPMVSIWFKIVEGNSKGMIFYNQVVNKGFQIHIVNKMCEQLTDGEIKPVFENFGQWNNQLLDVFEKSSNFEYKLKYSEGKNGFSEYKIIEVYDVQ